MQIYLDQKKKKKGPELALKFHFEGRAKSRKNREQNVKLARKKERQKHTMQTVCLLEEKAEIKLN